ncbi:MAG: alkylmercury lyase family protein [Gammaproteobacteria bacterium]|nr:alkylmercury lyase family protein [Gammaproteobacteria bacterium]
MNKVSEAVKRLNKILPLKANQQNLGKEMRQLHRDILYSYIDIGRSLSRAEIAQRVEDTEQTITTLQKNDLVVFDERGEPTGAYPFTMEKREHKLNVNGHVVHSMCALDSLAVSAMYDVELEIQSVCRVSQLPVVIKQKGLDVLNKNDIQDVYFAISWNAASVSCCCADSLCTEMIFIKGEVAANDWLNEDADNRQIFMLDEAIEFAAGFFVPLLQ